MLAAVLRLMTSLAALAMVYPEDEIRVKDILDPELLPDNLLLGSVALDGGVSNSSIPADNTAAGNFEEALAIMDYHRRMMNEYLCRGYVAGQILSDVMASGNPRADRRVGGDYGDEEGEAGTEETTHGHIKQIDSDELRSGLLMDPGSSDYKAWLSRATTLEDMYSNHAEMDDYDGENADMNFYTDYGEANVDDAGYEVDADVDVVEQDARVQRPYIQMLQDSKAEASSHVGHQVARPHGGGHYGGKVYLKHKTETGLSKEDIFELVCTAMALVAFALFKVNVLMSITAALFSRNGGGGADSGQPTSGPGFMMIVPFPPAAPTMPPLVMFPGGGRTPTTRTPPGGGGNGGNGGNGGGDMPSTSEKPDEGLDFNISLPEPGSRIRRALANDVAAADEVTRHALLSWEASLVLDHDGGECLRRWLCENNSFSRSLGARHGAWLPLWSVAMSWFGGGPVLGNVQASVVGLGGGRCDVAYPGCPLSILHRHRHRRRRRRRRRARP